MSPVLEGSSVLAPHYRKRKKPYDEKSVHPADVEEQIANGWLVQRPGKRSSRLKRQKAHGRMLEDRLWCLFHSMGYQTLNGENFQVKFERSDGSVGKKQVDVYAEDDETAIIIECKSSAERGKRSLQKDIQETISLQHHFRAAITSRFQEKARPKVLWLYATQNIIWSQADLERAQEGDIKILTENEIQYFETFIRHMGPAGKYQILGEFLKGQKIPGLSDIKLPAVRGKIGGETYYSFVATPRHLLKIAFINHQALNHPDGRPAYQRMISSSRIKNIGKFIQSGGFFPTNILINFSDTLRFDKMSNDENKDKNIKFGWVTLPSKYRSAWIIDGQHRLYGFSRLDDEFLDQPLFALAFEKMSVQREADLFITINHEQKSVPKSLLVSLLADLRMGDADAATSLTALGSAVVRSLNADISGPLGRRFSMPGIPPEKSQNLTISEVVKGLRSSGLIGRLIKKKLASGPLSGATDEETIDRSRCVLNSYFEALRDAGPTRWEAGRDAFICVNPSIRAHLSTIATAVTYLTHKKGLDFHVMGDEQFADHITSFCEPIFKFVRNASDEDIRDKFSRRFGEGGVKEYGYHLMKIIADEHSDFGTDEFRRWVEQSTSEQIDEVNRFLMKLAERLTDFVINTLKQVHGTHRLASDEQAFWELGVKNARIRKNAFDAQQRDTSRRGPKEAYLNIVDLPDIVKQPNNWHHFESVFNNPQPGEKKGQKYYLQWIYTFNELRNIAAHKNQLKTYDDKDLEFVEWLRIEIHPKLQEP